MWPISIKLKDMEIANIQLGYVGENDVTPVIIDCESVFSEYPNAVPTMTVQPPKGLKYPAEIERDGNNVIWTVQDYDLNYDGEGEIQIKFTENGKIKKSASCKTTIKKSIEPETEAPTPIQDWMERAENVLESLDGLTVSAETLATGEDATAEVSEDEQGHKHIDFGLPRGPQGPGPSSEEITEAVDTYLESNFTNPSNPPLDRSLLSSLSAAPADMVGNLKSAFDKTVDDLGVYDVGTTYNTLDATYNRVIAAYPIQNANDTFFYHVSDKSTNGTLSIRVTSEYSPYSAALLQSVGAMGNNDTELSGSFTIDAAVKSSAKYIMVLNATANLLVSFHIEMWTANSIDSELKETTERANFLNNATKYQYTHIEQGGFNGTTGVKADSNGTVRTKDMIDVGDIDTVSLGSSSGLHVQLYSYDSSGSFLGRNDLGASAFSYTSKQLKAYRSAAFVNLAIYLDGGGNFSPSDLETNGKFAIVLTAISTIPKMNKNTNTLFSDMLKTVGKTPMATWVDDDGVVVHTNGGISGVVIPVAEAVGIPVTFAVIPPLTDSVTVGGETMTKAKYFQDRQKEGHQIVSHPVHTYWYGNDYDITKVNPSLIDSITELQENGFIHSDMLVYPGSSGANPSVVEIVRKWCVCGVLSGYGTPNHLGDSTKWGIKRTFINFADYNSLHSSDPGYISAMAWYKSQVDSAFANGDWIVFGTHSYQFTESDDTTDPNANTMGNLQELMQYTVTKGLEFRTLWDAYNRRKYLFEFNEMNT